MTLERALLEVKNLIMMFEDNVNCKLIVYPESDDIDALRIALEAMEEQKKREDDGR